MDPERGAGRRSYARRSSWIALCTTIALLAPGVRGDVREIQAAEPVGGARNPIASASAPGAPSPGAVPTPGAFQSAGAVPIAVAVPAPIAAAVASPDRSDADRALDPGRHPAEMLAFYGIAPGMKVAELGAGGGYTAELLARVVGPQGRVWGQNSTFLLERFAEKPWSERLTKPLMANVTRLDRPFDDPFPSDVTGLDAVLIVLFYHDTFWQKVDRDRMNRAVFRALRPGGIYAIVDHSAAPGRGAADVESLHRVEESTVREEVERAGFRFSRSAEFLRNPSDPRDWNASPRVAGEQRGTSDRFVLEFVKP